MNVVKDITGRAIQKGDVLAVGARKGNEGTLSVRIVAGFKGYEAYDWGGRPPLQLVKIKTTSGGYLTVPEKTIIVPKEIFAGTTLEKFVTEELAKVMS